MAELVKKLSHNEPPKNEHGLRPGYQELPSPPEPKVNSGPPSPDVPGRTLGARATWEVTGNSAKFTCVCGYVETYNELPLVDMLRGKVIAANCCNVGRATPLNLKPNVEHARVTHEALEVRS